MKRVFLIMMMICIACLAGCNKDDGGRDIPLSDETFSLMDGSIVINNHPDVTITPLNKFPVGKSASSAGIKRMGLEDETGDEPKANNYRFKLVAEMSTLKIDGVEVQATHVKITYDGYAFVSYNEKGDPHRGGVVVYKFTVHNGTLENVKVDVQYVSAIEMKRAELSALDYHDGKLYMTGASSDPNLGYVNRRDGFNYAFFMVMELNPNMTFKVVDPKAVVQLTSFQGTSIRVHNNLIYITTGDGTNDTDGGLYVYSATDYSLVKSISGKQHARSVDVDDHSIYLMQANHARITRFHSDGSGETLIYEASDEALQRDAKSEILAWDKYLFVAENESGLRMLCKESGNVNESLERPGQDPENEVTNSVSMNSDIKKNYNGKDVASNLLFVANGGKGIYWYDIMNVDGKDRIIPCRDNSMLLDNESANFIESKGNIVFVANGLGGLKVLYIGFDRDDNHEVCQSFEYDTFIKDNGNDHGDPLSRKIGDVFFRTEGENLVVYLYSDKKINGAGVFFGTSLEDFDKAGLLTGSGNLTDKNINNGAMTNMNADKRTEIPGGVKFTFSKNDLPEGELLCIVYCNLGWGFGIPNGSSGTTGQCDSSNNNGQYIRLGAVTFCI
jgi:hypothetical protein